MVRPLTFAGHHIPDDVIEQICIALSPKDFLVFGQTCRYLHAKFSSSDYIWHQINHDLPLDLSSSSNGRIMGLSGPEIKSAVICALRLDSDWKKPVSKHARRIRTLRQSQQVTVLDMKPLGSEWLVVSQRIVERGNVVLDIALWPLTSGNRSIFSPSEILRLGPKAPFSFDAACQEGGNIALISVLENSGTNLRHMTTSIYRVNLRGLQSSGTSRTTPYIMKTWTIERNAIMYHTQVHGSVVCIAIIEQFDTGPRNQLLFFNTDTEVTFTIDSSSLSTFNFGSMRFKMYSDVRINEATQYIIIAGTFRNKLKVLVRSLPAAIFSSPSFPKLQENQIIFEDFATSMVDYETIKMAHMQFHISPEPTYMTFPDSFSVLGTSDMAASVYRFPIDTGKKNLKFEGWKPSYTINIPLNMALERICLGKTGRRAVWLWRHLEWNLDECTLMKASFPSAGENMTQVIAPLQPPGMVLPFEINAFQPMYLEEASGRLFVGVATGEVHILQF